VESLFGDLKCLLTEIETQNSSSASVHLLPLVVELVLALDALSLCFSLPGNPISYVRKSDNF
jgi:hypothetical protein